MYVFTMPANDFNEFEPDKQAIRQLICKHRAGWEQLMKLQRYYNGEHTILSESTRSNPLVCNHAKDIADTASAYFIGNPIAYKSKEDISVLTDALNIAGADEADGENGLDLSIYGRAYEYIYTEQDGTNLIIKNLRPQNTFIVYDDTIEQRELFAVYYYIKEDSRAIRPMQYIATVLTKNFKYEMNILDVEGAQPLTKTDEREEHFKGEIPIIEYLNNKFAFGDFEQQIPLIDAYNALMSDRVTDKEQFIDAILALYGSMLADEAQSEDAMKQLKKERLIELPEGAKAEYLTRTFDENGVEILKKALEQDIHKFSHIPCMSDENFAGNVSGVAMEFKLLGMDNITKTKTRYYRKGLRKRLRIFCNYLNIRSGVILDANGINPVFTRGLPKNLLEISQIVSNLWGKVSRKTLLSQVPFVDDVDEELQVLEKESKEAVKRQQEMFGYQENMPPDGEDSDEDEEEVDE